MLQSIPISKVLPKNISTFSADFLKRTLDIDINSRMCPEELSRFLFENFNNNTATLTSTHTGYGHNAIRIADRGSSLQRTEHG